MKYQAVFFDLDDTLYDETSYVKSGFNEVALYLSTLSNNEYSSTYILNRLLLLLSEYGRGKTFNLILEELNFSEDQHINTLIYIYRNHKPKGIQLFDDMEKLIDDLYHKNIYIGVITDGVYVTQRNKTEQLLKNTPVDLIIHTDSLGYKYWKPSKVPFEVGVNLAQVPPENSVYIGDNPIKDFKGANEIGMDSIWWNPNKIEFQFGSSISKPNCQVNSVLELKKVLS